jgi:glycosyltransferase involved in cell wall biosynthesis
MIHSNKNISFDLSIVIPIYNEEDNVEILYKEIIDALEAVTSEIEIIFVDDGSSDHSFEKLESINLYNARNNRYNCRVKILKLSKNFGQTAAMQAGFDHAQGEIIISMDGDLQNDPNDIPQFLTKMEEGYDVVCGWRKLRQDKRLTRILPSRVANWMIRCLTGVPIHDNGCSLKAYRKTVIKSLKLYSDMHRFIPAMATIVGAKVTEIEVNHRARKYGKTKYGLSRTWKVAADMATVEMLIHFGSQPLAWFAGFGFLFLIFGSLLGIISIFDFLNGEKSIVFVLASILLLFLFSSLLSWGLLADFFIKTKDK